MAADEGARVVYTRSLPATDDPYPAYRWLRDHDPAHHSPVEDIWVLTRYDDCVAAFSDWRTWSSQRRGNLVDDLPDRVGRTLGTTDPPRHTDARKLVSKAFTPRTVAGLEPFVGDLARRLVGAFIEAGGGEVVQAVSAPFNAQILGATFGVPESEFLLLRGWLDDFFLRETAEAGAEPPQMVAMRELREYLGALAEERVRRPGDDLMTAMLTAEEGRLRLTRDQVVVTTMTFLTAGFESTNNLLTNAVLALAQHPDVLARLRSRPADVPAFVEEAMRYDAAAQGFVRAPTRDVELHGTVVPEGAQVLVHIGAANRDERRFPDPDRFDLDRDTARHLGLGHGTHFCVGAPLARSMVRALFAELVPRIEEVRVDAAAGRRVTTPNFRGFSSLPVEV